METEIADIDYVDTNINVYIYTHIYIHINQSMKSRNIWDNQLFMLFKTRILIFTYVCSMLSIMILWPCILGDNYIKHKYKFSCVSSSFNRIWNQ